MFYEFSVFSKNIFLIFSNRQVRKTKKKKFILIMCHLHFRIFAQILMPTRLPTIITANVHISVSNTFSHPENKNGFIDDKTNKTK